MELYSIPWGTDGRTKMSQASSSYLSFPQIHLSAFKQQNVEVTRKESGF